MKSVFLLMVCILVEIQGFSVATYRNIKIDNYSYKQGLTTSNAHYVYKDSKGFLWLCSMDGVFRYDGYTFRNLNTIVRDTLKTECNCITEDEHGNFIIGTNGKGIYYYNTQTERVFPIKLGIGSSSTISHILFYHDKIWLASNIGLIVLRKEIFNSNTIAQPKLLLPDPAHKTSQYNSINVLMKSLDNSSLWVGSNGALFELNIETFEFDEIFSHPQNAIRCLSPYTNNMIIVGSWDGGIFGINTAINKVSNDSFITEVNTHVGHARINNVYFDAQGRFWVATYGDGLYIFEKDAQGNITNTHLKNDKNDISLKSDLINRMYLDYTGTAWICMNQPALSKVYFPKSNTRFYYPGEEDAGTEIFSVSPSIDKDKFWVATLNNGIYLYNSHDHKFVQFSSNSQLRLKLKSDNISFCFQDSKGCLWIADRRNGLFFVPSHQSIKLLKGEDRDVIDPIKADSLLAPNFDDAYITNIYEDTKGRIWISTWGSLYVISFKQGYSEVNNREEFILKCSTFSVYSNANVMKFDFPLVPVYSVLEIDKNTYWIGTSEIGVFQLRETKTNSYEGKLLDINEQLPGKNINCLYKDSEENIWIGTNFGLGYISKKTGKIKIITKKDGLTAENINNIVEDNESNIWVSTPFGISKINQNDTSIKNYFNPESEKLNQYIRKAGILTTTGTIYFSSNTALTEINPGLTEENVQIPPIYFTDIKIDNHKVIPNEKYSGEIIIESNINKSKLINVPYNHTLSIEFAALDFISPEQRRYKYRVGDNKEWVMLNPNQRSLILPAMGPGEYTLEIAQANLSNGDFKRSIRINYLPPYWQTKLAFVLYLAILSFLFYYYRKLTIQRIQKDSIIEKERYKSKKLEELNVMKSEFFSDISHEFRTPLSLIINPIENHIADKEIPDQKKEKLALALKSSYRLLKLTNELMDFSKIEKKLLLPEFTMCEMVSLIDGICEHYSSLAESMNIDFKENSPFEKLEMPVDRGMIEKVMYNLLSNAFKYTPENGIVMVNLNMDQHANPGYLKISVINTGEGISQEAISKIFDKYYQVNNVRNKQIEGTGIGLSLVKSYVEFHNGQVEVKSELNKETCFDIYLPLHQEIYEELNEGVAPNKSELHKLQVSKPANVKNKPSSHYSILLVEDDNEIRRFIAEELAGEFKIITAKNGGEGYKYANEIIPDLIISDIVMPVLSGIELCKKVKSQVLTSHIPFILLSAKATINQQIEGLETGADVFIPKPFNIGHVRAQVLRLLSFKETVYLRYLKENSLIPKESLNSELDEGFMQKIITFIEDNLVNPNLNVEQLAEYVSLSHAQTYRKVRAISGMSAVKFIRTVRLKKAAQLIAENKLNYTEIAYETGFSSLSYFTRCFHDHFGKSPSDFAAGLKNKG